MQLWPSDSLGKLDESSKNTWGFGQSPDGSQFSRGLRCWFMGSSSVFSFLTIASINGHPNPLSFFPKSVPLSIANGSISIQLPPNLWPILPQHFSSSMDSPGKFSNMFEFEIANGNIEPDHFQHFQHFQHFPLFSTISMDSPGISLQPMCHAVPAVPPAPQQRGCGAAGAPGRAQRAGAAMRAEEAAALAALGAGWWRIVPGSGYWVLGNFSNLVT